MRVCLCKSSSDSSFCACKKIQTKKCLNWALKPALARPKVVYATVDELDTAKNELKAYTWSRMCYVWSTCYFLESFLRDQALIAKLNKGKADKET